MERISIVTNRRSKIGESPHWDQRINQLLYVDIFEGAVIRLDPETKEEHTVYLGDHCVSLSVPFNSDPNQIIISRDKQLCNLEWNTEKVTVCGEVEPALKTRFNDGKCDVNGKLWAGTMALEIANGVFADDLGGLYTMDRSSNIVKQRSDVKLSNGLAWDKANRTMFYIDSLPGKILVFDYDAKNGSFSNERTLVDFQKNPAYRGYGLPDGMTIDEDDKIWLACFNGGCVLRIDPETGSIIKKISFPAKKITSCAFGGPEYNILYVTSGWLGMNDKERSNQPEAGAIFKVTGLERKGLPPNNFSG